MAAPGPPAEPNEGSGCVCQCARPLSCWQRHPRAAQGPVLSEQLGAFPKQLGGELPGVVLVHPFPFSFLRWCLQALSRCRGCVWAGKWGCACSRWEPRGGLAWASTCSLCSAPRAAWVLFISILPLPLRLRAATFLLPSAWCCGAVLSCQALREQVKHHGAALEISPTHLELVNADWKHFGSGLLWVTLGFTGGGRGRIGLVLPRYPPPLLVKWHRAGKSSPKSLTFSPSPGQAAMGTML